MVGEEGSGWSRGELDRDIRFGGFLWVSVRIVDFVLRGESGRS